MLDLKFVASIAERDVDLSGDGLGKTLD